MAVTLGNSQYYIVKRCSIGFLRLDTFPQGSDDISNYWLTQQKLLTRGNSSSTHPQLNREVRKQPKQSRFIWSSHEYLAFSESSSSQCSDDLVPPHSLDMTHACLMRKVWLWRSFWPECRPPTLLGTCASAWAFKWVFHANQTYMCLNQHLN